MKKNQDKNWLIKSASLTDLPALKKMALKYPLMNLPSDDRLLAKKICLSEASFASVLTLKTGVFFFLLKTKEGKIIGSSQLSTQLGTKAQASYSLKMFKNKKEPYLKLHITQEGPSYLGGLILEEKYRGHPLKGGKQISLIRFLFVAMYPELFRSNFRAEVAPFLDQDGKNLFFENFIRPRIKLSMEEIDYLTLSDKEKLFSLYPREKILLSSLPKKVQESLGKPGFFSQRAASLLQKQNFKTGTEIDPFDGGPYIEAQKTEIPFIQNTKKVLVECDGPTQKPKDMNLWLFGCMENSQFTGGLIKGELNQNKLLIFKENLSPFNLQPGDSIFISPF